MKPKSLILAIVVTSLLFTVTGFADADYVPGELIVKFEHDIIDVPSFEETPVTSVTILDAQFVKTIQELNVKSVEHVFKGIFARPPFRFITKSGHEVQLKDLSQVYLLRMDETLNMEQVADELRQLPGVIYAEPNYVGYLCSGFPNDENFKYDTGDELYEYQWGFYNRYPDKPGWDVNALKAWSVETGDRDIILAIIDSGLESDHYDEPGDEFYGRVGPTYNWTDGPLDDEWLLTDGYYVVERGHGTHVAGTAAAATNTGLGEGGVYGVAGIAGGWSGQNGIQLAIGKVIRDKGKPSVSVLASAIEWAVSEDAQVLNASFGYISESDVLKNAVENALQADVALFFPSGTKRDLNNVPAPTEPGDLIEYPARWAAQNLCSAVGSINEMGYRSVFSFFGPALTFVAPGELILSTSTDKNAGEYYFAPKGTSFASPFAAGIGALLYSSNPNLMDIDYRRIMEHTAMDIERYGVGWDDKTGYGCVDAWEALRHLYWPYTLEHQAVAHSQLQKTYLGYSQVVFLDDQTGQIAAGPLSDPYFCEKYCFSGSVTFTSGFAETPWFWERILSEPLGYYAASNGTITTGLFGLTNTSVTASGASFETYTYYVKYDAMGRWVGKWVPYDTADIAVAITALGRNATSMTYLPRNPSPTSAYGLYSDLVVDRYHADVPNTIHISYYDMANKDLRYIVDDLSDNPNDELVASNGDVGRYSSIALDYEGYPHIVYLDQTNYIPKHAYRDPTISDWTNEIMWDRLGTATVYYTSIAIGEYPAFSPAGQIHACGYLGNANPMPPGFDGNDLVYMTRDGSLPYGWHVEPVDVTGNVGAFCSIASYQNVPYISYYDVDNSSLKCAVKNGTWTTYTVDNSGNVGEFSSIAIDLLGGVHISYYDAINDELKYAYKAQGSSTWSTETVDQYSVQGTSICIDDDGRPVIAYGGGAGSQIYSAKKLSGGWSIQSVASGGDAWYGISVGIDNLGRMATCYYDDSEQKLYMTRLMRWPQESDYGLTLASQNAEVKEQKDLLQPALCLTTPNPIRGSVAIKYSLPYASNVRMAVFDVTGRLVKNLLDGEQNSGEYELLWEGVDDGGRKVSTGVYFIRMEAGDFQVSKKVALVK